MGSLLKPFFLIKLSSSILLTLVFNAIMQVQVLAFCLFIIAIILSCTDQPLLVFIFHMTQLHQGLSLVSN